ncbi:MAG: Uma2 family endonuclease [Cyanobacteria bacterium P01_G01_bin.54]
MTQTVAKVLPRLTPQEYFAWEAQQPLRYEYFDGDVFAMAGGTLPHADIALNLASLLREPLRGRCKVRNSDAKVGITDDGPFTYPDLSISCDERDRTAQEFIRYPCVIVEVLSPSTEAYDRGGKFALYRRLSTLQEYVLVSSETKAVEIFQRTSSGEWRFIPYSEGDIIELITVEVTFSVDAIYEDVVFGVEEESSEGGDRV